jgi:hypothetical protein
MYRTSLVPWFPHCYKLLHLPSTAVIMHYALCIMHYHPAYPGTNANALPLAIADLNANHSHSYSHLYVSKHLLHMDTLGGMGLF